MASMLARSLLSSLAGRSAVILTSPTTSLASKQQLQQQLVRGIVSHAAPAAKKAKYGGRFMATMLPGDGIGPEMMGYVRTIFKAAGIPVDFEEIHLDSLHENPETMEEAIIAVKRNGVAMKGNIETREHSRHFRSRNIELRLKLDLCINVVHCKSQPGIQTRHQDIDVVIIRQNTEGEYSCMEHEGVKGVVECLKVITKEKADEVARYAFDYALAHGRKKVTCVHKANIMKVSDGLFLQCCREVAQDYPSVQFDNMIIDNCSMQLVSHPNKFDVLVLPNLYGNILTNIACGLVGGPGILSGVNIGPNYAVFETVCVSASLLASLHLTTHTTFSLHHPLCRRQQATRNTGKNVAGKNIANPIAVLNSAADMLEYLALDDHCAMLRGSLDKCLNEEKIHTPDLGGTAHSTDVINFILHDLKQKTQNFYEAKQ